MPLDISKGGTASATAAGARLKLGLTDLATMDPANVVITGGTIDGTIITGGTLSGLTSPLAIADGGTNSTTEAAARTALFGISTTTDNAIARYDGTTGSLQNSSVTIDDSGNIVTSGSITGASFTGTIDADTLDGIDSTGFATAAQGTLADNAMPKSGGTFSGGISFGSATASGGPTDLTRHIRLWGSSFGFSITDSSLNYVIPSTSAHHFYVGAVNTFTVDSGVIVGSPTGGDPGAGKVNAVDYQINGTPLSSLFVPISDYTAADVLTKIKTVDGSGSGLDADTLDGHDTSYFQTALGYTPANKAGDTFTGNVTVTGNLTTTGTATSDFLTFTRALSVTGTDLNDLTTSGFYNGQALTNSPDGGAGWWYIQVIRHENPNGYCLQIAWSLTDSFATPYIREQTVTTWHNWYRVWTENDFAVPSTPDYGAGNAALAQGAVGTYTLAQKITSGSISRGGTLAAANLRYVTLGSIDSTSALSGTWRLMSLNIAGGTTGFAAAACGLWLRIA